MDIKNDNSKTWDKKVTDEIYLKECPIYNNKLVTLRQTNMSDVQELLKCYSDEKAVRFFNSDNCHGDDFYYITIDRMKQAIDFWEFSYKSRHFVRWTVIYNDTNEKIGTIEMFHRIANDEFNHFGVLRMDLQSNYETKQVINDILQIVNDNFYDAFDVKFILTKAIPEAAGRINSLIQKGYQPLNRKLINYDDYFVRTLNEVN